VSVDESNVQASSIALALAEYFECEPEAIGVYAVICERATEDGPIASSVWTTVPHWYLIGLVDELKAHVEGLRVRPPVSQNGEVP